MFLEFIKDLHRQGYIPDPKEDPNKEKKDKEKKDKKDKKEEDKK